MSKKEIKLELEVLEERIAPAMMLVTPGVEMVMEHGPHGHGPAMAAAQHSKVINIVSDGPSGGPGSGDDALPF